MCVVCWCSSWVVVATRLMLVLFSNGCYSLWVGFVFLALVLLLFFHGHAHLLAWCCYPCCIGLVYFSLSFIFRFCVIVLLVWSCCFYCVCVVALVTFLMLLFSHFVIVFFMLDLVFLLHGLATFPVLCYYFFCLVLLLLSHDIATFIVWCCCSCHVGVNALLALVLKYLLAQPLVVVIFVLVVFLFP